VKLFAPLAVEDFVDEPPHPAATSSNARATTADASPGRRADLVSRFIVFLALRWDSR
jgi:hypothetical protein